MAARKDGSLGLPGVLSHLGVMVVVSAVLGVLVAGLALPFAGVAGLGARSVANGVEMLPAKLTAQPLAQRSRLLASNGRVLATFFDQNRVNVPLDRVALIMRKAVIAIEDYRFYQHGAMDPKGTLRAFITNQANADVVQGGSSITQQMVKMTLVNQADNQREVEAATAPTYERKLRELRYAIAFEDRFGKNWILQRYLNLAYFGDGAYGVQAAARHYFSKPASKLNLREAALLAGMVKNPTGYDPTDSPGRARERRDVVLQRMAELNVISRSEAAAAERKGLGLKVTALRNGCVSSAAPFFCDYAVEYLLADPTLGRTVEDRQRLLNTGGLTIRSTLDPRMQRAADASVRRHVYPRDRAIGGLAMVRPGTGAVTALAQSRPMGRDKKRGETYLNYVVPRKYGDANGFQAGSTFKVFVLSAAIKQGIPLTTRINAPQTVSIPVSRYRNCQGPIRGTDVWSPQNSTGAGTFNLYTGTRQSVNTFFAQLELRTGLCQPVKLARAMGLNVPDPVYPPFTLGVSDTDPLSMAGAYATFAARGRYCAPRPVTEVRDRKGRVLQRYPATCRRVLPAAVADAVNSVLRGVQQPGGFGYSAGLALNQPSAGKTGTTNSNRAVWFIGYTPNLAAAAMLAGANGQGQWRTLNGQVVGGTYISGAAGSTNAGPIWGDAMKVIQRWLPDRKFTPPNPRMIRGRTVVVPSVYGFDPQRAAAILRRAGLNPAIGPLVDSGNPYGTVAFLSPGSGSAVGSGSSVTIYISDGTPAYTPPPQPTPQPTPPPQPTPQPTPSPTPQPTPPPTRQPTQPPTPQATPPPTRRPTPPPPGGNGDGHGEGHGGGNGHGGGGNGHGGGGNDGRGDG